MHLPSRNIGSRRLLGTGGTQLIYGTHGPEQRDCPQQPVQNDEIVLRTHEGSPPPFSTYGLLIVWWYLLTSSFLQAACSIRSPLCPDGRGMVVLCKNSLRIISVNEKDNESGNSDNNSICFLSSSLLLTSMTCHMDVASCFNVQSVPLSAPARLIVESPISETITILRSQP